MRYIALLRAINVGGHNVTMERLRGLFSELGLESVASYIQTGNIFFDSEETNRKQLAARIEEHLHKELGYEVPVILRTAEEVERALALDPFKDIDVTPDKRFSITFYPENLPTDWELPLLAPKGDFEVVAVQGADLFMVWYLQDGRPGSSMAFADKKLGMRGTTRFFATTAKILAAARA